MTCSLCVVYALCVVPEQDRVAPKGGAWIAGTFLSEGTVVACHIEAVHLNRQLFGEDASEF